MCTYAVAARDRTLHIQRTFSIEPRHMHCTSLLRRHNPFSVCAKASFKPPHLGLCSPFSSRRAFMTDVVRIFAIYGPTAFCLRSRARCPSSTDVLLLAPDHLRALHGRLPHAKCWRGPSAPLGASSLEEKTFLGLGVPSPTRQKPTSWSSLLPRLRRPERRISKGGVVCINSDKSFLDGRGIARVARRLRGDLLARMTREHLRFFAVMLPT